MENRLTDAGQSVGSLTPDRTAQDLQAHHYELLFGMTTQLLAAQKVDERLLLTLDTLTSGLGHPCAALALIDKQTASLQMRMAVGFPDDDSVRHFEMPLDSNVPYVSIVHDGRPAWITRQNPEAAAFLDQFKCNLEMLALPLFGEQWASKKLEGEFARRPYADDKYWLPESMCLGALYIGAERQTMDEKHYHMLLRFADCVGVVISAAMQTERLASTVSKLQRERQWVESIMKSVADPIVLTNLDNEILLQNRRAEELFSGSKNASEGKRRALEMNDLLFSAYLSSAAVSSTEIIGRDLTLVDPLEGSDIHFEVISTPALNARGERIGMVSIFRDVTDLRRANEELARNFVKLQQAEAEARRERDRLDLIIENVGHPVAVCDSSGNFILFNARAEHLFQQEAVSEARAARAVRANAVKLTSFISALASGVETGRQAEIELLDPETGVTLPMEITSAEVSDAKGQVTAVVSILHDLSEIRELERRRVEQQLFESEKLAAVGRLAASIAHEVNNPLEAIKNSLYLLTTSKSVESNERFLEVARKETERVSHIIRQMLGFARRSGEVEWVTVNQILEETLVLVEKKLRQSGVRIARAFDGELPRVRARADQLRQVFLNLVLNAQQAIEGAGEIKILTEKYEQALQPSISIQISDSGRGIGEAEISRIFEPFFSTRTKGTGLGLWVTQDIVRHHGGRIEVTSTEGRGTTFNIILPINSPTLENDGTPQ
ncbi:MAG TPA: ATP-binding protein [Pyrinomonadaceae bacterium]|jgi:PAS domain S-box-containing protein|nr:ATP-binding protein [Pyrinomonadaceae bacterium]